jgi:Cdc6-like AAA superfamily ATPase
MGSLHNGRLFVMKKCTHPIETGKYLISTNEIDRMYQTVIQWIENRIPGAIIYGRPRLGKTRAITYLMNCLPQDFGKNMPIYHIRCRTYKNPNENFFFEDLLLAVGHASAIQGKANMKRIRLLRFLVERADVSGTNRIIFFIDDWFLFTRKSFQLHEEYNNGPK